LIANPSQEQVFDIERLANLKILQPFMGLRHGASLIAHESEALVEDPLKPNHSWGLKQGFN